MEDYGILSIKVTGIKAPKGYLMVAVYDSAERFLSKGAAEKAKFKIGNRQISEGMNIEFRLPPGDYAVSIYQDENMNGKLDTNFMGMPVEKYGFSNNARDFFGPPGFEKARVALLQERLEIDVEIK